MAGIHTLARSCPIFFIVNSVMTSQLPTLSLLSRRRLKLSIVGSLPCPSCWVSSVVFSRFT
nr:MAG TPA: hypothetical protein [Caudoviricetes sp.]